MNAQFWTPTVISAAAKCAPCPRNRKSRSESAFFDSASFFVNYKRLEPKKWVRVKEWMDAEAAEKMILSASQCTKKDFTPLKPEKGKVNILSSR